MNPLSENMRKLLQNVCRHDPLIHLILRIRESKISTIQRLLFPTNSCQLADSRSSSFHFSGQPSHRICHHRPKSAVKGSIHARFASQVATYMSTSAGSRSEVHVESYRYIPLMAFNTVYYRLNYVKGQLLKHSHASRILSRVANSNLLLSMMSHGLLVRIIISYYRKSIQAR